MGSAADLAAEVLRAVAVGALPFELVEQLAASVLARPEVRAALELRDATGPSVARRAVELAALVIAPVVEGRRQDNP